MITVHGLLGAPGPELLSAAARADRVVGGRRHLDALGVDEPRRITLGALRPALALIAELPDETDVVVVASGDPGYFGVVRSLRAAGLRPAVVPAPSSIAEAFAAVGLPWDDAVVVSAHGRPLGPALNLARAHPKVAVFTSAENGIRELAAGLEGCARWFVLAERLGDADASIQILTSAAALTVVPREPNVVLVLDRHPDASDPTPGVTVSGIPDRVRPAVGAAAALVFARLLPGPGESLYASGPLADEVTALAVWAGAAIVPHAELRPDVILSERLPAEIGTPRAVILTGARSDDLIAAFRWTTDVVDGLQLTTGVPA